MKYAFLVALSLFFISCGTTEEVILSEEKPVLDVPDEMAQEKPERKIMVKASIGSFEESDPLTIDEVHVRDNIMRIYVTYSGGCEDHGFKLIGSPMVMKSLPPKRAIQLAHDNMDDNCRGMISTMLEIDISTLAYNDTPGSTIILQLKGWKEDIEYTRK